MRAYAHLDYEAKHANGEHSWGVDGETGKIVDMKSYGLYESASVKVRFVSSVFGRMLTVGTLQIQTFKTAIEVCFHCRLIY